MDVGVQGNFSEEPRAAEGRPWRSKQTETALGRELGTKNKRTIILMRKVKPRPPPAIPGVRLCL